MPYSLGTRGTKTPFGTRARVSGSQILDDLGNPLYLKAVNFGQWGFYRSGDAALVASWGFNAVRFAAPRWWGSYGVVNPGIPETDSRCDECESTAGINPANIAFIRNMLAEIQAAGLWIIPFIDSNCGQSGLQAGSEVFCGSVDSYATTGRNFYTDPAMRDKFVAVWIFMARLFAPYDRVAMLELLPEPLDGRNSAWTDANREFYRYLIRHIRLVDPFTPFLIGPRNGYDIDLIDEAYLPERTDVIITGNYLNAISVSLDQLPTRNRIATSTRAARNVPVFIQQAGRNTSADATLDVMRSVISGLRNNNIGFAWWQAEDKVSVPNNYGLMYSDGGTGRITKTAEVNQMTTLMSETGNSLEAAAVAAATAAGGRLYYAREFSRLFQDSAGTTAVTATGQPLGRLNPAVGAGNFLASAVPTERPNVVTTVNGIGWQGDGVDDYLAMSSNPYVGGDDTAIIVAGAWPSGGNTNRVLFHAGTSGTVVRYPYLAVQANDLPTASWRGDDSVLTECAGASATDNAAFVWAASKVGTSHRLLVNGVSAASATATIGSIASFTRARVGSNTAAGAQHDLVFSLVYEGKTLSDPQMHAIGRFGAWLAGASYAG
jgi:Cellulase (glycosyl hydrolase family 5)